MTFEASFQPKQLYDSVTSYSLIFHNIFINFINKFHLFHNQIQFALLGTPLRVFLIARYLTPRKFPYLSPKPCFESAENPTSLTWTEHVYFHLYIVPVATSFDI